MMKRLVASLSLLVLGFHAPYSHAATGCSSNASGGTTPLPQLLPAIRSLTLAASDPLGNGDLQLDEVPGLLKHTICSDQDCTADSGTYVLINVITWRSGPVADSKWYIYRGGKRKWSNDDFRNSGRMYGAKSTYLLSLQITLGVPVNTLPAYSIQEDKRIPQNVQDVTALLQSLAPARTGGGELPKQPPPQKTLQPTAYWTGKELSRSEAGEADVCIATTVMQPGAATNKPAENHDTPNADVQQNVAAPPAKENTPQPQPADKKNTPPAQPQNSPAKSGATGATLLSEGAPNPVAVSLPNYSFTDEPKQWWDVSVAVPISKISDVTYSSANGVVTPNTVNRQSVFGVLDLYFPKKDMVGNTVHYWPHPVIGVSLASKPLQSWIAGLGIGLPYGEVYAGANVLKTSTLGSGLTTGSTTTPEQVAAATGTTWKGRFNVGLNISVTSAFKAIKSAGSKTK